MREIRTLRATWRGLETWCGSGPRATPARQPSTLPTRLKMLGCVRFAPAFIAACALA